MLVKIHSSYRKIVSICDEELLGKKYKEGKIVLDIQKDFYDAESKTKSETIQTILEEANQDSTFIIIGNESVDVAIQSGVIEPKGIRTVQNIPFILVLL